MFSFGQYDVPAFGGVGVMLDRPSLVLELRPGDDLLCEGPLAARAETFAHAVAERWGMSGELRCALRVAEAPPQHVGLGTGTQLAMAVAAGLNCFLRRPDPGGVELARCVGRGRRSAIGLHGFSRGGLIVDPGRLAAADNSAGSDIPAEIERVALPDVWRFVLLRHHRDTGRHGEAEESAFAQMPPVPLEVTAQLQAIVREEMLPAARMSDCARFGEAVYEFGRLAGACFASHQTGAFASTRNTELVRWLRESGVRGVGQSSWGPTVFALAANAADAQQIVADVGRRYSPRELTSTVAGVSADGAVIDRKQVHR
jgi:beta-RFAP synthase